MALSDSSAGQYVVVDPILGVPTPVSVTQTSRLFPLGLTVRATDANTLGTATAGGGHGAAYNLGAGEFVYVQGSNVASRGQFCHLISNSAVLLDSANSASFFPIGLAAGALSATNVFGWVQIAGLADYATHTNNDFAANARVALGTIAGQVASVTALGSRIHGIILPVSYGNAAKTASAPNMTVQLQRPFVIGITASN